MEGERQRERERETYRERERERERVRERANVTSPTCEMSLLVCLVSSSVF